MLDFIPQISNEFFKLEKEYTNFLENLESTQKSKFSKLYKSSKLLFEHLSSKLKKLKYSDENYSTIKDLTQCAAEFMGYLKEKVDGTLEKLVDDLHKDNLFMSDGGYTQKFKWILNQSPYSSKKSFTLSPRQKLIFKNK